jgi:hypothetical protein
MDATDGSRARLGYPVCYTGVMGGSRALTDCPVEYVDVTDGSRAMLGFLVCYTGVMDGSRAMLGCLGEVHGHHKGVLGNAVLLSVLHGGDGKVQSHAGVPVGVHLC